MTRNSEAVAHDTRDKVSEHPHDVKEEVKAETQDAVSTTDQATTTAEESSKDKTNDVVNTTQQAASSTQQTAQDKSRAASYATSQNVKDIGSDLVGKIEQAATDVKETTAQGVNTTEGKAKASRPKTSSHDSV